MKDAPRVDPDGDITPEEEDRLYSYYARSWSGGYTDTDTTTSAYSGTGTGTVGSAGRSDRETGTGDTVDDNTGRGYTSGRETVGRDTSGPTTDDAMTRSEEQLRVGTQKRETGRARLRKYVGIENVTQTVPVSREEVRIEREPITDANRGAAMSGPDISEEEHEIVLHEEGPVVEKETVPVERVRLDKETVTDEATVSEEVRKEQIDTDTDPDRRR